MISIQITKETIKNQVQILRQSLEQDISQSAAYQILARIYGYPNWNTLSKKLEELSVTK